MPKPHRFVCQNCGAVLYAADDASYGSLGYCPPIFQRKLPTWELTLMVALATLIVVPFAELVGLPWQAWSTMLIASAIIAVSGVLFASFEAIRLHTREGGKR